MRQHIDTIPVWDAFKTDCECPLCALREQNEIRYAETFTGGSVMEPDVRVEVNNKGFCARHFKMMMMDDKRLGVALMAHTYLRQTMARLGEANMAVQPPVKGGLFSRRQPTPEIDLSPITDSCILCDRLNEVMDRYVYTVLQLWKKDGGFRMTFKGTKGFCLKHYAILLKEAPNNMSGMDLSNFTEAINTLEMENLKRLEQEIEWFTLKFDHKNADKPWGTSRDSLPRVVEKLRGKI